MFDDPAEDEEFLSVPVMPVDLPELASSHFADLVNRVPDPAPVWRAGGRHLWAVYEETLTDALVADVKRSDSERDELTEARALLFSGDGEPSDELRSYRRLRDAYYDARQRLNDVMAGEHEPAAAQEAQTAVEDARHAWVGRGRKADIEAAQSVIDRLEGQRPILAWNDAKAAMEQSERIDAVSGGSYYETTSQPGSLEQASWTHLRLDVDDIQERSAELREDREELLSCAPMPTTAAPERVSTLNVEACLLRVLRPWFEPALLAQRTWRFATDREPLSDGGDPPSGRLPAYVIGVVVLRDATMTSSGDEAPVTLAAGPHVVAFLCHRMPKAPDPDPGLDWSG